MRFNKYKIRELREQGVKLTQDQLAKLMGVDASTVSKHEKGDRVPDFPTIRRYAEILRVDLMELIDVPEASEED